jgi:hypothetical protein
VKIRRGKIEERTKKTRKIFLDFSSAIGLKNFIDDRACLSRISFALQSMTGGAILRWPDLYAKG